MTRRLRVAVVAIGIGRFQRGFERYFSDLAEVMQAGVDLTLFGGAPGDGRRVPRGLAWATRLAHRIPVGRVETEYGEYKTDCLAYGLALWPELMTGQFDIVHVIDPPLAKVVEQLLRITPGGPRLLYTNGTAWPIHLCPRRAHVHHVQIGSYRAALAAGDPVQRNTLVPCGIHARRFDAAARRAALRQQHGLAESTLVVLVVAAVKRVHKRLDHVITEVCGLEGDFLLWIDGKPEEPDLADLARSRLGPRCRVTHVASAEVGQLYAMADLFVHAALEESFGLAIVEALSTGLPVLVHDSPHFEWLVGSREPLVDMSRAGALRERLSAAIAGGAEERSDLRAAAARQRYDWPRLRQDYQALYEAVAA
jgi:glycosyltransferase involved in cell wall biosynthesis